jgi:SAM-dependent methyltransferase
MSGQPDRPVTADEEQDTGLSYILPHHPAEIDRLDVQHYALQETLLGNYLAPIGQPRRVLDVGAGTGQWAYELCAEFPQALVVGLDVEHGKPRPPANYGFVLANLLSGLPFATGAFDFVHQRLMVVSSIPVAAWPGVVAELARVTSPGGWVELVEVVPWATPAGPAGSRLFDLVRRVGRLRGLDMDASIIRALGEHLERAGLTRVEQRTVEMPVGEWGGRVGSLTATNLRAFFSRLSGAFESELRVSKTEFGELLRTMQREWEHDHPTGTFVIAFGRTPEAERHAGRR